MVIAALLLYLTALLALRLEKEISGRALSSFRLVIHVNGIRWETDVCAVWTRPSGSSL